MSHVWRGTQALRRVHGDNVAPGETFEATEAELRAFGDVIESVDTGGTEPPDESEEITCAEGDCSRTVAEAGMKCWQHED